MAKFEIPKFRYLTQDGNGEVWAHTAIPYCGVNAKEWYCAGNYGLHKLAGSGEENTNWRDTLIDLDKDDYEFEDGILRRIER